MKVFVAILLLLQSILSFGIIVPILAPTGGDFASPILAVLAVPVFIVASILWGVALWIRKRKLRRDSKPLWDDSIAVITLVGVTLALAGATVPLLAMKLDTMMINARNAERARVNDLWAERSHHCHVALDQKAEKMWSEVFSSFPLPSGVNPADARPCTVEPHCVLTKEFNNDPRTPSELASEIVAGAHKNGLTIVRNISFALGNQIELKNSVYTVQYSLNHCETCGEFNSEISMFIKDDSIRRERSLCK